MQELELTWKRFSSVAWLFFWRMLIMCVVGGVLATFLFHWLLELTLGNPGPPGIGAIVWVPLILLSLRMVFRKEYSGFRIALVSTGRPTAHLD